jgi:hypothetical protein
VALLAVQGSANKGGGGEVLRGEELFFVAEPAMQVLIGYSVYKDTFCRKSV